jgi:hypothetical protein
MPGPRARTKSDFMDSLDRKARQSVTRIAEYFSRQPRSLLDYHACGKEFLALQSSVGGYGTEWMGEILSALKDEKRFGAKSVKLSKSFAYRLIKFAEQFDEVRVAKLDGALSWESVTRFLHVDPEVRDTLLDKVLRRSRSGSLQKPLSTRGVQEFIKQQTPYRRPRRPRNAPRASTHPNQAVRELRVLTEKWESVVTAWLGEGQTALVRARQLRSVQITDDFIADLAASTEGVSKMSRTASRLAEALSEVKDTLRARV